MRPLAPRAYERLTLLALAAVGFIIVTGGAVRLTGSGLGCPDWPTCAQGHVVAQLSYHPLVEFLNRVVTGVVSIVVVLSVLGSRYRQPRRRDLTLLSWGLVAGVGGQIVLGGITVMAKLAPPFVMAHFLLSMALLADAVVLHHRAGVDDSVARGRASGPDVRLAQAVVALVAATLVAGTVVTSSGPHGGDENAPRWTFALHRVTQIHGALAMTLALTVVASLLHLHRRGATATAIVRGRQLVEALAAQIAIGYTQYFTGVPPLLVGIHVAGAALVWVAAIRLLLAVAGGGAPAETGAVAEPRGTPTEILLAAAEPAFAGEGSG
jgi:cytochrome c oxidase assembly protein subunit 15